MQLSDLLLQNLFGFASALIGGTIGGIFTLKATDRALRESDDRERKREEKEVQNLLDALAVEMKALWEFHMRRVGTRVEQLPEGKALEFYYPLTQDYFTIYNANAPRLGRIKEAQLREAIVVCYNKCKKVVDGFKYNNELFRVYRSQVEGNKDMALDAHIASTYQELADYAHAIKEDHYELKGYVERMLQLLQNRDKTN